MQIVFCISIAIPKGTSGEHSLRVLFKSDMAIMSKLHVEKLKFVHSSSCLTIPELVLSDQLNPDTHTFRTS